MKALTLWEPWATLVAGSVKQVETRSWGTPYRGPLAVHAARKFDAEIHAHIERARADLRKLWGLGFLRPDCQEALFDVPWQDKLGCVVAVARLADCRPMPEAPDRQEELFGAFGPGRWGWLLEDVRPVLPPVPCPGARGLWDLPAAVQERILAGFVAAGWDPAAPAGPLAVACPRCRAEIGARCRNYAGKGCAPHRDRVAAHEDATRRGATARAVTDLVAGQGGSMLRRPEQAELF